MYLSNLCLAALLSTGSAFTLQPKTSVNRVSLVRLQQSMMEGPGAGDDNAALFGAPVPGMPTEVPKAPPIDEDNPMGGEMFRKMMEKAKAGGGKRSNMLDTYQEPIVPQAQPQAAAAPPPPPQGGMDPYAAYLAQLQAWQQAMTAYAQFSATNPEAAAQMQMPAPPQPPQMTGQQTPAQPQSQPPVQTQTNPVAAEPSNSPKTARDYMVKGDGRNPNAYEVNNAADVYFAQLKRDSAVRNDARKRGDIDAANKPFSEEGVKILKDLISPELTESRRKQMEESGGEFETSRDEMLIPYEEDEEEVDVTYTGVNYREKLMLAKQKKARGGAVNVAPVPTPAPAPVPVTPSVTKSATVQSVPAPVPAPIPAPVVQKTEPAKVEPQPFTLASGIKQEAAAKPVETTEPANSDADEEEAKPNFALPIKDMSNMEAIPAPSMEDSEDTRRMIRTLMGLLLKHRGGPGFGHGRLKGVEAERLEIALDNVLSTLKEEAGMASPTTAPPAASIPVAAPAPPAPVSTSSAPLSGPLAGAIACVDAAVSMYKNADAAGREDLLLPLRDALLSSVSSINKVVAEKELNSQKSSNAAPQGPPQAKYATTMEFPETYKVTQPEEEEQEELQEIADAITRGGDVNTELLAKVYESLKAISGDEKFGIRDVSTEEISDIRESLIDMREVLMEELDSGIPS